MNSSRRRFFKTLVFGVVAAPLVRVFGRGMGLGELSGVAWGAPAKSVALPDGQKAVLETDPVASAIGYKADKKNVDAKKYPQTKKPDYKKQSCSNCSFYTKVNDGWGKCTMLPSGVVAAQGWCGSWQKKA